MIIIRHCTIGDAPDIFAINQRSLGYSFPLEKATDRLEYILARDYYQFFVAEDNETGKVVGYVQCADYDNTYFEPLINIMGLAVLEEYQGMGIGKKLMTAIEEYAYSKGFSGIRLSSGSDRTEAHKFYEHIGYSLRKEQKNFIKLARNIVK